MVELLHDRWLVVERERAADLAEDLCRVIERAHRCASASSSARVVPWWAWVTVRRKPATATYDPAKGLPSEGTAGASLYCDG
jgi:hypothetical protein